MIDKWKLILQDVQKSCNHASSRCQEMQVRVEESVNIVKAADEYKKFTDINKTAPPAPVVFKFDETLLSGKNRVGQNRILYIYIYIFISLVLTFQ